MSNLKPPVAAVPASKPLSPKQQLQRAVALSQSASTAPACTREVSVGVFFDGTNNNKKRDQEDITNSEVRSHTNVVVLHDAYADIRPYHYAIYIPGVGTPFPKVGELTESSMGKAMAKGGEARLYWAMIQTINAIHRAATGSVMIQDDEAKTLVTGPSFLGQTNKWWDTPKLAESRRNGVFMQLGNRLRFALRDQRPKICQVHLSVFGFSRGAAEARTFCNWLLELCTPKASSPDAWMLGLPSKGPREEFFGVPLHIQFVGLFDTVASVGLANSSPIPNDGGFMGWADGTMELPAEVARCVHYVAAHEIRKSFPLSTAGKSRCAVEQHIYPGSHSDVGGGYSPGDQGKGKQRAEMVAQVPLIHMYQVARAAGVPLLSVAELEKYGRGATKDDLQLDPKLADRFNAYRSQGPGGGELRQTMLQHLRMYWRWRLQVSAHVESLQSVKAASPQHREDLLASEADFRRDLAQAARDAKDVASQKEHPFLTVWAAGVTQTPPVSISQAEIGALQEQRTRQAVPTAVAEFFDLHIHDSHATFYLVGATTAADRKDMIEKVQAKQKKGEPLNGFERRVAALQLKQPGAYPVMRDADYEELLDMDGTMSKATVKWLGMSRTRRESEGHVRERVLFDKS